MKSIFAYMVAILFAAAPAIAAERVTTHAVSVRAVVAPSTPEFTAMLYLHTDGQLYYASGTIQKFEVYGDSSEVEFFVYERSSWPGEPPVVEAPEAPAIEPPALRQEITSGYGYWHVKLTDQDLSVYQFDGTCYPSISIIPMDQTALSIVDLTCISNLIK